MPVHFADEDEFVVSNFSGFVQQFGGGGLQFFMRSAAPYTGRLAVDCRRPRRRAVWSHDFDIETSTIGEWSWKQGDCPPASCAKLTACYQAELATRAASLGLPNVWTTISGLSL